MNGLLIFVKAPEPGRVKSRLAQDLRVNHTADHTADHAADHTADHAADHAADDAAALYRCFGLDWLARLAQLAQTHPEPIALRLLYSPVDAAPAITTWLAPILASHPAITLHPQRTGDLGDRLDGAFQDAFAAGITRAIAVGSDSPDAPTAALAAGFAALTPPPISTQHESSTQPPSDCVLAPATDGGYWAIGFRGDRYVPAIFAPMAWSVPTVAQETRDRLRAAGRSCQELATWSDVDDLASLRALAARLRSGAVPLPHTTAWLAAIGERELGILAEV